ncbi:MAG: hypothetical protein ABI634_02125 [Acidobacteriota bacterium]
MILFAFAVASVFGALLRDEAGEQVRVSARIFVALVGGAYLAGWLMHVLFR